MKKESIYKKSPEERIDLFNKIKKEENELKKKEEEDKLKGR